MNEVFLIRRASVADIDFLVETIVAAEKSGTENFGLARLFDVSEVEMRGYIRAMLDEEIDGCEFSLSSFLVAEHHGITVSAFAGWAEGQNDDELSSALLKSNLISYCLPTESVKKSQNNSDIVRPLQIEREEGAYQLEYSYTLPEYRGKGILGAIIEAHEQEALRKGSSKMQIHVFDNNPAAISAYEKKGFKEVRRYESGNPQTSLFFPSNIEILMEKEL